MGNQNRPPVLYADTPKKARRFMDELYKEGYLEGRATAVDSEFVPVTHEPVLLSYSWGRGIRRVVRAELVKEFFGDWMTDPETKIVYQNYKEDAETMETLGIDKKELARSFHGDVMVMGVLVDETLLLHSLKAQAFHFLKWFRQDYKHIFCYVPPGKKKPITMDPRQVMDDIPEDALLGAVLKWGGKDDHKTGPRTHEEWIQVMLDYAGDDAESTDLLFYKHKAELRRRGYWKTYCEVDRPFTLTLMQCEQSGAFVDQPILQKIQRKQHIRIMRAEHCFRAAAGDPKLNLRSGPQMKKLLIDEWGWPEHPEVKTDSGGVSMDKEVLTWWLKEHGLEMSEVKLAFNNATTMNGTFLQGILDGVSSDGRLRSDLNQIGAKTCLPAGELVLTDRGYIAAEDVRVGDQVITHEGRARRVLRTIDNGKKRVYRTTLSNGLSLLTTSNHEFMTNRGWIQADQLDPAVHFACVHSPDPEEWREIIGWAPFEVSSWGRVRNASTGHVLTLQRKTEYGHLKVMLHRNGAQVRGPDRKDFPVHRLVMEAFSDGVRKPEVRHWNGIPWDNTKTNLGWATRKENAQDSVRHQSAAGPTVYPPEAVEMIRSTLHVRGGRGRASSDQALADHLGMTRSNVSAIRLGRSRNNEQASEKRATFYWVRVVSVERLDVRQTYGLVVDEDHSHVTGGIVTHNSGRISSRKFDVMVERERVLKDGTIKKWIEKKKAGANLQNIPARKEKDPDGIRGAFRAPRVGEINAWGEEASEPHVLLVADYSGFHLVLVIHFISKRTKKSAMLEIMKKYGTPSAVHVYTTIQMFKHVKPHYCSPETCKAKDKKTGEVVWKKFHGENKSFSLKEFTMKDWEMVKPIFPDQYTYAKNTNFALIFLGSPWTLAYNTGRNPSNEDELEECKRLFDDWYSLYPEVKTDYQDPMVDHGYEHGWVPTIGGRRGHVRKMLEGCDRNGRYIHDEEKRKKMVKHGERVCTNTPAQGCLHPDTRIITKEYGVIAIGHLAGDKVTVWDGERWSHAGVMSSGDKREHVVRFWGGLEIHCSPDHLFLTNNNGGARTGWTQSWKCPGKFNKQQFVVLSEAAEWSAPVLWREYPSRGNGARDVSINALSGFDQGLFLGRVASDGSVVSRDSGGYVQLHVAEHEKEILPKLRELCTRLGRYIEHRLDRTAYNKQPMHRLDVNSTALALQIGDVKERIPDEVWADSSVLRGYLCGMFDGDGTVCKDGPKLTFGSGHKHEAWAREVQQALFMLGIRSRLKLSGASRIDVCVQKADSLRFAEVIGFLNPAKQKKLLVVAPHHKYRSKYGRVLRVQEVIDTEQVTAMFDVVNSDTERFAAAGVITHNSEADIVKMAMNKLVNSKELQELNVAPLFPVHDEVVCEGPLSTAEKGIELQVKLMKEPYKEEMDFELSVEGAFGEDWLKAKP